MARTARSPMPKVAAALPEQPARFAPQFQPTDERRAKLLRDAIFRRAAFARNDVSSFYEFVMREELTGSRIKTLPFQRVVFAFLQRYPRAVIRLPVGFSKTYMMIALTLFLLGQDQTARGAVISATETQAEKVVTAVRQRIEESAELRLVYPELAPTQRDGEPWTQTQITVKRPHGIRDPSLRAVGINNPSIPGARLKWIVVDDILTEENTNTPEQRKKVHRKFFSTVKTRLDVQDSRIVVCNVPWHPDDLTYRLEKAGWPTLTMDIEGNIFIANAPDFDTDDIRPSAINEESHRLTAHDRPEYLHAIYPKQHVANDNALDTDDLVPLWPEKFTRAVINDLRETEPAEEFNHNRMCKCLDEDTAKVKPTWIEVCKSLARDRQIYQLVPKYTGPYPTVCGLDLAFGKKKKNDQTCFFIFAVLPSGHLMILDIDIGRWDGKTILEKLKKKIHDYGCTVRIETNAAQVLMKDWALAENVSLPVRAHVTGKNKRDHHHGVESVFLGIQNGAWLIPNGPDGRVSKPVAQWVDDVLYYDPDGHTGDALMASWLAREEARAQGLLVAGAVEARLRAATSGAGESIAASITAR